MMNQLIIEAVSTAATILAVTGVVLNNRKRIACFYVWLASNTLALAVHTHAGLWAMSVRDVIFLILAIEGLWRWRKKGVKS